MQPSQLQRRFGGEDVDVERPDTSTDPPVAAFLLRA